MVKMFVKKNDTVLVITGKDKGKKGKVLEVSRENNKVLVENINIVTKHQKPKSQQDQGGIIKKNAPIESSNVMVVCPACGKATRVSHKKVGDKNTRICKKCGAVLDKEMVKTVKKEAKKATKATPKTEEVKEVAEKKTTAVKTEKKEVAEKKTTKTATKKA